MGAGLPSGVWRRRAGPGRTRLRASREVERSALLAVIPEALRNDEALNLIDFHKLGSSQLEHRINKVRSLSG